MMRRSFIRRYLRIAILSSSINLISKIIEQPGILVALFLPILKRSRLSKKVKRYLSLNCLSCMIV